MEKQFTTYKQELALKELGFDELCIASWNFYTNEFYYNPYPTNFFSDDVVQLPLKSQVFKWFREKHDLHASIGLFCSTKEDKNFDYEIINHDQTISVGVDGFKTYEEAEDACIDKLIELIKNKKND